MALQRLNLLTFVSSVDFGRSHHTKIVLEIELKRKGVRMGSDEEIEISHTSNGFLVGQGSFFSLGFSSRVRSLFREKCRSTVVNALFRVGALEAVGEDERTVIVGYLYNTSRYLVGLHLAEIVIRAEIELVTVFQGSLPRQVDESVIFDGGATVVGPQSSQMFDGRRRNESIIFVGSLTWMPSQVMAEEIALDGVLQESELTGEQMGPRTVPAATTAIQKLKTETFQEKEGTACTICLDPLVAGMQMKRMPCMHFFHEDCIVTWLERSNSCPLCRIKIED